MHNLSSGKERRWTKTEYSFTFVCGFAKDACFAPLPLQSDGGQTKKQHVESEDSYKPRKHDDEEPNKVHDSAAEDYHDDDQAAQDTFEGDDYTGGEYDDGYNYGNGDDCEFDLY